MHRALEIFVYNIMRKRRTLYDLSETIVVFLKKFFFSTYKPWVQSKIRGYFKKEIMKEAHLESYPNGTKVR